MYFSLVYSYSYMYRYRCARFMIMCILYIGYYLKKCSIVVVSRSCVQCRMTAYV